MTSAINVAIGHIIFICLISNVLTDTDLCARKGPCKCEFANGTGIDLTASASSAFYSAQMFHVGANDTEYSMGTYYFHPCYDTTINISAANNTCTTALSLCRHLKTLKAIDVTIENATKKVYMPEEEYDYLGTINNTQLSNDGGSITYFNGPSSTTVKLVCAQTPDMLHVYSIDDPRKVTLVFYTRNACLKQIEDTSHRSFGSTLLIIFFSCLIFYLVLGILTKKFLMGATGIEVIPNLSFWTDLPDLCRDGWAFIRNGFKVTPRERPAAGNDPNSYDSI